MLDEESARMNQPKVPMAAILANHHGYGFVMAQVDVDGKVLATRMDRSTGHSELDESAEAAVRNWKFQPCYKDNHPYVCWARVPVTFSPPNNPVARHLALTFTQPGVGMPAAPPYSIPWPRGQNGQPLTGTTVLLALVNSYGLVADVTVEKSSGHDVLDAAAMAGVRRWRFRPEYKNGVPFEGYARIPVAMNLDGLEGPSEPPVAPASDPPHDIHCTAGMNAEECKRAQLDALSKKLNQASAAVALLDVKARNTPTYRYLSAIQSVVMGNWLQPDGLPNERCIVHVEQLPGGKIVSAIVDPGCPYDAAGRRSVENAVLRTRTLPYKNFENVFQRKINLVFIPYQG